MKKTAGKTKQKKLTRRQKEILDYLRSVTKQRGYPPSIREICNALELSSSSTVHNHLCNLEERGYIKREPTKPRSIEVIKAKKKSKAGNYERLSGVLSKLKSPLKEVSGNKAGNIMSKILLDLEDRATASFLVEGQNFSSFGINNGDMIIIKSSEIPEQNNLVIAIDENSELITGYYEGKNRKEHYIKTEENILVNLSVNNFVAKITGIIKN